MSAGAHCKEVDLGFAITRCRIGDEGRLSLLGKATFLESYADSTEAADLLTFVEAEHSAERYRSWLESDFVKIWIAETIQGHSAIGYAVALVLPDGRFTVEIKRLYVLHRFQQNGLGRLLMNEILATARHDGIAELFLKVQKVNRSAVDFYSRNGFRVVGEEGFRVGARDHEALVMRLALDTPQEHPAIFAQRFSRSYRLLHSIACRVLGDEGRAPLAIQKCWITASRNPPRFEYEGAFRSWLLRVLIDEALAILGDSQGVRERALFAGQGSNGRT